MKIGLALPQIVRQPTDLQTLVSAAELVDQSAVEEAWLMEQVVGAVPVLEPLTTLGYVAAHTQRVRIGAAVLMPNLGAPPLTLARMLASVDVLSGGRLDVGLGVGAYPEIYPAFGLKRQGRGERFEDALALIERAWSDGPVSWDGPHWQMSDIVVRPRPVQRPRPPLYIGAWSQRAIDRAVRLADGWLGAGMSDTEQFAQRAQWAIEACDRHGRDQSLFRIGKRVYVHIAEPVPTEMLAQWFHAMYGQAELADRVVVAGSPANCIEQLLRVGDLGADWLILDPVGGDLRQLASLVEQIVPELT